MSMYFMRSKYGEATGPKWKAEDNWIIGYTTTRIQRSTGYDGKFAVVAWKPNQKKNPTHWDPVYFRAFSTRKAAKKRALEIFANHSPRWAARNAR